VAAHDVGIIYAASGAIVVAVYGSENRGPFESLEAAQGRIAEWLLDAWGS
jgi:hypothetical protein